MRVLVTGASGFVGAAVTARLREVGHDVVALTRRADAAGPGGIAVDIRDRRELHRALSGIDVDAICHLAGATRVRESHQDPAGHYEINVGGTASLLAATTGGPARPRVVFASTGAVYGGVDGVLDEDVPLNPQSPYAASKCAAETLLTYAARADTCTATVLRCFSVSGGYGHRWDDDPTRIIPNALRAAAGELPHMELNGDGSAVREFSHVLDVAEAFRLALEADQNEPWRVYNVGTGHGVAMRDLIELAEERTGRPIRVVKRQATREPAVLVADSRRIRTELGWHPSRSDLDVIVDDAWSAMRAVRTGHLR